MGGALCTPQDAKAHGNAAFAAKDYYEAAVWYSRAIEELHYASNKAQHSEGEQQQRRNPAIESDSQMVNY